MISVNDKIFGSLLNNLLRICGKQSYLSKVRAYLDFPIEDFCGPSAKVCRIEARTEGNTLYHFLETFHFPGTPTISWLEGYLKEREELLSKWVTKEWHYFSPLTFLKLLQEWMFLTTVRRTFDFNVFLTNEEFCNLVKVFNMCPDEFRFWECITNLISKIWFFEHIVELNYSSKDHVSAVNALLKQGKIVLQTDPLLNKISNAMEETNEDIGFPVYASTGEIVLLRSLTQEEILNGFMDKKKKWYFTLENIMSKQGYALRYQWPFGTSIKSCPVDVCLSFKSSSFKGDGLPDYF